MFRRRITLFRLLGFSVRVDASWLIIAVLVTWSLAEGTFRVEHPGLPAATYWAMGIAGALLLFGSITFHELCHSLVARRFGLSMRGITLFIFGGVAEMSEEPPSPKVEFLMAIAGPLSTVGIAAVFFGLDAAGSRGGWPFPILGVIHYTWVINVALAIFNLLPGFPLDGGRVLRSILWAWKNNLRWATRVASHLGGALGAGLIVLAVLSLLGGNFVGAMWWFLIGLFLRGAAAQSYQQLLMRQAFEGEPVRHFMNPNPITVPPSLSIEDLVEHYIYAYHYKMFPVARDGDLLGCVTIQQVKGVPRGEWPRHTVGELVRPCSDENTLPANADALAALATMHRAGVSRLMVVDGPRLVGIVTLKDMLKFLGLKVELESGA